MIKIEDKYSQKLLVEGKDDMHVVFALVKKFSLTENFDIIDCNGIENLFDKLEARLKILDKDKVKTIGVLIDADENLISRINSINNILERYSFNPIPKKLLKEGYIGKLNSITKLGVWIMPNNETKGMLEDFLKLLVPKNDKLLPLAEQTLSSIETQNLRRYSITHKPKALIHTWLSWQDEPGKPLGQSITAKYLSNTENAKPFVNWLTRLFSED